MESKSIKGKTGMLVIKSMGMSESKSAQLKTGGTLRNLAALLSAVAVRLLQLRDLACDPRTAGVPAMAQLPALHVKVLARLIQRDAQRLSVQDFWHQLAKLGGWLGRKNDPPPGWLALWRGWLHLDLLAQGAALFSAPSPPAQNCVEG